MTLNALIRRLRQISARIRKVSQSVVLGRNLRIERDDIVRISNLWLDGMEERRTQRIQRRIGHVEVEIEIKCASSLDLALGCESCGVSDMVQCPQLIGAALYPMGGSVLV